MRIVIPGEPIAKTRHRSFIRNGHIATYDNQHAQMTAFRYLIAAEATTYPNPIECLVKVDLIFQMDCIKGCSKSESVSRQWGYSLPRKKPDLDNLEKFVLDCGNGILWLDDRYIVQLSSRKIYSKNPCTIIEVTPIREIKMAEDHEKVFKTFSPEDCECMSADAERIYMSIPAYKLSDHELYESQMAAAAELLIDFADEWTDKLKKIKRKANQ